MFLMLIRTILYEPKTPQLTPRGFVKSKFSY